MKKITLLFTFLFSINTLTGMKHNLEPENFFPLDALPIEAKASVVKAISTFDNLDDIINTIETTKLINGQFNNIVKNAYGNYNDLTVFTTLVHCLSDKFPEEATEAIAKKFAIPTAQKYVELGTQLLHLSGTFLTNTMAQGYVELDTLFHVSGIVFTNTFDAVKQIIKDGADVNFTTYLVGTDQIITPAFLATHMQNFELLKLLSDAGIKTKTWYTMLATCKKIIEAREARGVQ